MNNATVLKKSILFPRVLSMNRILIITAMVAVLAACGKGEPEADVPDASPSASAVPSSTPALVPQSVLKNLDIQTVVAGPGPINEALILYGRVVPNAERVREVRARFPGIIKSISKAQGDVVKAGETLATVESDESLQTYTVSAPIGGVVTARDANPGERSDSDPLFVITDVSSLWVELSVFPRDRARIRAGQSLKVRAADGGIEAQAQLSRVDVVGGANQAVTARAVLANTEARWAPGLYVVADVVVDRSDVAIRIPRSAVQYVENRETVFVRTPDGYTPHAVKLGRKDSDQVEVLEGLAAGDTVARTNTYVLASEVAKPEPEE